MQENNVSSLYHQSQAFALQVSCQLSCQGINTDINFLLWLSIVNDNVQNSFGLYTEGKQIQFNNEGEKPIGPHHLMEKRTNNKDLWSITTPPGSQNNKSTIRETCYERWKDFHIVRILEKCISSYYPSGLPRRNSFQIISKIIANCQTFCLQHQSWIYVYLYVFWIRSLHQVSL